MHMRNRWTNCSLQASRKKDGIMAREPPEQKKEDGNSESHDLPESA